MLRELEVTTKFQKRYQGIPLLRRPLSLLLEYRLLEAITFNANKLYGGYALPTHALVGQLVIFSNVTMIREWTELDVYSISVLAAATYVILSFWIIVLEVCGKGHSIGKMVLKSWRNLKFQSSSEAKYFHKVRKSCNVIYFGVPNTFRIRCQTENFPQFCKRDFEGDVQGFDSTKEKLKELCPYHFHHKYFCIINCTIMSFWFIE
jgi:hypothetical protein